ncbi:MAG: c-type cytochrome [Ferruginibacter sp.]
MPIPNNHDEDSIPKVLISVINKLMLVIVVLVVALIAMPIVFYYSSIYYNPTNITQDGMTKKDEVKKNEVVYWTASDINTITDARQKEQVAYGKELITHTSKYFGPKGSILQITNGLNCQNCHLQAGTAVSANNYGSVASLYPKLRARSGKIETVSKRVNDCFERSLNGRAIDTMGKEMQAIVAYIHFIGNNVEKGKKAAGSGFKDLTYLDRAAEPQKGQMVYTAKCQSCHQPDGEGLFNTDKTAYNFPALWGAHSFNDGAGLYRISNIAKYVKFNMPQGTTYKNPQLTDEEAWDVASFIISQPRPHVNEPKDWPDISKKPVDHPFGPYADSFSEQQHKYGPFKSIEAAQNKN